MWKPVRKTTCRLYNNNGYYFINLSISNRRANRKILLYIYSFQDSYADLSNTSIKFIEINILIARSKKWRYVHENLTKLFC